MSTPIDSQALTPSFRERLEELLMPFSRDIVNQKVEETDQFKQAELNRVLGLRSIAKMTAEQFQSEILQIVTELEGVSYKKILEQLPLEMADAICPKEGGNKKGEIKKMKALETLDLGDFLAAIDSKLEGILQSNNLTITDTFSASDEALLALKGLGEVRLELLRHMPAVKRVLESFKIEPLVVVKELPLTKEEIRIDERALKKANAMSPEAQRRQSFERLLKELKPVVVYDRKGGIRNYKK